MKHGSFRRCSDPTTTNAARIAAGETRFLQEGVALVSVDPARAVENERRGHRRGHERAEQRLNRAGAQQVREVM
eukprot:5914527-Pleurochrysis_carterae.AAC.1